MKEKHKATFRCDKELWDLFDAMKKSIHIDNKTVNGALVRMMENEVEKMTAFMSPELEKLYKRWKKGQK